MSCRSPGSTISTCSTHLWTMHSTCTAPDSGLLVQVGAALSMVYTSGAPIMFVGCGQTYVDLKRLNVKSVVRSLLK